MSNSPQKNIITHEELVSDKQGFEALSKILLEHTGIFMDPSEKNYSLMSNRMHKVLKKYNCNSYNEFIKLLEQGRKDAIEEFQEVLTTNTTHFFRENEHFIFLKKVLPTIEEYITKDKRYEIRVWCAAASTGEEPYTILMTLLEYIGFNNKLSIKFVATDINTQVLEKAREGIYRTDILENISPELISKYFEKNQKIPADCMQIKDKFRGMIEFAKLNLISDAYLFSNKFDIIFCRNVMIYFPQNVVEDTVNKLSSCLEKKGFLFIGHSEAMLGNKHTLKSIIPAVYQHKS